MAKQSENDINQLKTVVKDLSNVYKSQSMDDFPDNGNLEEIHKAIIHTLNGLRELERRAE